MKKKIRRKCKCGCGGITNHGKRYINGHNAFWAGRKLSKEHKRKLSEANKGRELSKKHKKKISKSLCNHHIYLDKKRCSPQDIMTLCNSCHAILHRLLEEGWSPANSKDYIIINRPGHVSYIHKESRKIIRIKRKDKKYENQK